MLFTLLTFPLGCTLDIEQCGRGRLLAGPFANEAIKSILPWLSKGQREQGKSSAVSANTKHLRRAAARMHNEILPRCGGRPVAALLPCQWDPLAQLEIAGGPGGGRARVYPCAPIRGEWK